MSAKHWVLSKKKSWQLRFTDASITKVLVPEGPGKNCFTLQPVKRNGKIVYLKVSFRKNAMAKCWKDVILFPRGHNPAPRPDPALPETPTAEQDQQARSKLHDFLTDISPYSTERLEGEMTVTAASGSKMKGALTLVQVPKGLGGKHAWLAVFFNEDISNPNGTGGGGSVHN